MSASGWGTVWLRAWWDMLPRDNRGFQLKSEYGEDV